MAVNEIPYIPENIRVKLGAPNSDAEIVTVPFIYYIKNVVSSEIYPTWPDSAIRANIYAALSFALNRIYTEWYPSKGYDFDITSSTSFDQKYIPDKEIYDNIAVIVDNIFNSYVRKKGTIGPMFTAFCNGTTVTCDGLSQWGTVALANQGKNSFEILQNYYGNDIEIVSNVPVSPDIASYPGKPLGLGDIGNDVANIEIKLNRIQRDYPAIPRLADIDGVYGPLTGGSVLKFQEIFNLPQTGEVDKATWYKINYIYASVKKLGELTSEGVGYQELLRPYTRDLAIGSTSFEVIALQYYLLLIGNILTDINPPEITGVFDEQTRNSLIQFQKHEGLPETGTVTETTKRALEEEYQKIVKNVPADISEKFPYLYPGKVITLGTKSDKVTDLQNYLNVIAKKYNFISPVPVSNIYDTDTEKQIKEIQKKYVIPLTGTVGPVTWYYTIQLYKDAAGIPT